MRGSWLVVTAVEKGQPVAEASLKGRSLLFDDGKLTITAASRVRTLNYKLDAKAKPCEIDISQPDGKGKSALGIYEIDGDTLKLCYGGAGDPRPDSFASERGSSTFYLTLKREVKK